MSKRAARIFILITSWVGLTQSTALACECLAGGPNEYLQVADVVFAGKVIAKNKRDWWVSQIRFERRIPFIHFTKDPRRYRITFEVSTVWKGEIFAKTSVVHVGEGGHHFRQGEEYIVYARQIEGELRTDGCARNNKLSEAGEDLAAFGAGRPPAPYPSLAANYIRALVVVFLLLSALGWAGWQARRKYGAQMS